MCREHVLPFRSWPLVESEHVFVETILSKPGAGALKYRSPDGTVAEIVAAGRYEEKKEQAAKARA